MPVVENKCLNVAKEGTQTNVLIYMADKPNNCAMRETRHQFLVKYWARIVLWWEPAEGTPSAASLEFGCFKGSTTVQCLIISPGRKASESFSHRASPICTTNTSVSTHMSALNLSWNTSQQLFHMGSSSSSSNPKLKQHMARRALWFEPARELLEPLVGVWMLMLLNSNGTVSIRSLQVAVNSIHPSHLKRLQSVLRTPEGEKLAHKPMR